jgi:hypothetical protein
VFLLPDNLIGVVEPLFYYTRIPGWRKADWFGAMPLGTSLWTAKPKSPAATSPSLRRSRSHPVGYRRWQSETGIKGPLWCYPIAACTPLASPTAKLSGLCTTPLFQRTRGTASFRGDGIMCSGRSGHIPSEPLPCSPCRLPHSHRTSALLMRASTSG